MMGKKVYQTFYFLILLKLIIQKNQIIQLKTKYLRQKLNKSEPCRFNRYDFDNESKVKWKKIGDLQNAITFYLHKRGNLRS